MNGSPLRLAFSVATLAIAMSLPRSALGQGDSASTKESNRAYSLVVTSAKRVRATLTAVVNAPNIEAKEWMVFAARLPELPAQIDVRSALSPRGRPTRELSEAGRPILAARVPASEGSRRKGIEIRVDYEATLLGRKLVEGKTEDPTLPVVPPDGKARRLALSQGRTFDFRSPGFQGWLRDHNLRRGAKEGDVDFARRVYLEMNKSLQFRITQKTDRRASQVCLSGVSDSAGLSIAFVSALRANNIPARVLTGRLAEPSGIEPKSKKLFDPQHAKAEFFARDVGWLPVDLTSALISDKTPDGLRYFGNDDGELVTYHLDNDLQFDTYFRREAVEWLTDPSFWATGSGSFEGQTMRVDWKIQTEPLDVRQVLARETRRGVEAKAASKAGREPAK